MNNLPRFISLTIEHPEPPHAVYVNVADIIFVGPSLAPESESKSSLSIRNWGCTVGVLESMEQIKAAIGPHLFDPEGRLAVRTRAELPGLRDALLEIKEAAIQPENKDEALAEILGIVVGTLGLRD